jgi:hypothetical protein
VFTPSASLPLSGESSRATFRGEVAAPSAVVPPIMKRALLAGLVLFPWFAAMRLGAASAAAPVTLADTETRFIESKIVGQKYELFVALPKD